jgi:hypothetical protein
LILFNSKLKLDNRGAISKSLGIILFLLCIFAVFGSLHSGKSSAESNTADPVYAIKSGLNDECLDVHDSGHTPGAVVDDYSCNSTNAQSWNVDIINIKNNNMCLSVNNDSTSKGAAVLLENCTQAPGQVWLDDNGSLFNPNSQLCISEPSLKDPLIMGSCDANQNAQWSSPGLTLKCDNISEEGPKVACYADKEWELWKTDSNSHEALLNTYTDGAPYEEWCADFVSYVYKEAGYPFTKGETNGWDQNIAGYVQYMGFNQHSLSIYAPSSGDVGYFDYAGGHVEIVVSGGTHPTFIYGNSGKVDPTTGNGEMEANTIIKDGSLGNLTYYLSPQS